MAAKKETTPLRGAKLMKTAIAAAKASDRIPAPEPFPASLLKKARLPNDEPLSPALKELLAFDGGWLGFEIDDEEGDIDAVSLEDIVEEHFGEEALPAFGEAYELLTEDCIPFGAELERPSFLYVGVADDAGEYPVVSLSYEGGVARVGGFVPFDVWAAQELGGLERAKDIGDVPPAYAALPAAAAEAHGLAGRVVFTPAAGEAAAGDDDEEEDDAEGDA